MCLAAGQLDERQTSNLLPGGKAESGREMTAYLEKAPQGFAYRKQHPTGTLVEQGAEFQEFSALARLIQR